MSRPWRWMLAAVMLAVGGGCTQQPWMWHSREPVTYAAMDQSELRDILAGMARSHEQKLQLVFYISLPWKGVDPAFRDFYARMAQQQRELDLELRAWAKAHDVDLSFHFGDDVQSKAQQTMEDRQQKVITEDNRTDLTRDTLIQMWADYEWQVSLLQNLLPKVRDPGLRHYLEHSLKVHEAGSVEITALLKRFKAS